MYNVEVEKNVTELHQKIKGEEGLSIFEREIKNENVIVVAGCTKSGKSTLINYLIGTRLISKQNEFRRTKKIVKHNRYDEGPEIGVGVVSCTKIPQLYSFENSLLIDLPGFDDNRGPIQDIINSLYISRIRYSARVKFVMVYDLNLLLNDNVNQFIDFLDQVHTLFNNFEQLKDSVVMVFSKDSDEYSVEEIANILRLQVLLVEDLEVKKELVSHLVDTIARLAIFRAPKSLDDITNAIDHNIKEAIAACPWSNLNPTDIKVSVSLGSRHLLQKIYSEYLSEDFFYDQIKMEVEKFRYLRGIRDYIFASTTLELQEFLRSIHLIRGKFDSQSIYNHDNLQSVANSIKRILIPINADFKRRLEVLADLDNLVLMNDFVRMKFIAHYRNSLIRAIIQFELLIQVINSEQNSREKEKTFLTASTVAAGGVGVASTLGTIGLRLASRNPLASLIAFGVSSAVTAAVAVPAYMQNKKIQESNELRISARRLQNRWVTENMFE